jgi:hypothetical protein
MDIITKLPEDIQRYIYEFDPTYKIKYSYCMVSITMMSNQLLYNKYMTIIQIKQYKKFFDCYIYMSEHSQQNSFENRRNNVHFIKEINHFKTDNPRLWGDIIEHNKDITKRKNYKLFCF